MTGTYALHAIIHGRVQGVCFRAFVANQASQLGLKGYVKNLPAGDEVEVCAEGEKSTLEMLLEQMKIGPPGAEVLEVTANWASPRGQYLHFTILR
jgi:acylphosphatase